MKKLFGFAIFLALLWSGWWFVGSAAQKAALEAWLDQQRARGWVAERDSLTVRGFPNRFDTVVTGLELADPRTGWSWMAPEFQILALSYKPNHIIAVWPGKQSIGTPFETVDVAASVLRGSVVFEPDTALALQRSAIEIADLRLESSDGWTSTLERGQLNTAQAVEGTAPGFAHDIAFQAERLTLPEVFLRRFDPAGILPGELSVARTRFTASYDAPWDRLAVEGATPLLTAVSLKDLTVTWGELDLKARGSFDVDGDGFPQGRINVTAVNWREMVDLAVSAGVIPQSMADTIEGGLEVVAMLSGGPNTIDVPLVFSGSTMSLGPVPLGRSPRFN